uniref:Uncharacterized protein n=1 Tax=Ralstonia solanacearum TaxID=305 RepID=A0A0S4U9L1_RALSL|nr:conserved protein of unknown function [Ralstonia solanacearum]CUV30394.1 conserved protein of unknown function [Ralstonia solanacearum]
MSLDRPRIHPVAFLCPEDAAFITGADLAVNGGRHPQRRSPQKKRPAPCSAGLRVPTPHPRSVAAAS